VLSGYGESVSGLNSLREAVEEYTLLGYDTLPLRPGTKEPHSRSWQSREPYRMWRSAPPDSNVGIRCGGDTQIAIVDCDEKKRPGTFAAAQQWLAGLGCLPGDYPVVQTASVVGRQIWLRFTGGLPGNLRLLSPEVGAGEFRYGPGAYVVAPPSQVGSVVYTLQDGDYRQLPRLVLADIWPILGNQDTTPALEQFALRIPRRALSLMQGKNVDKYSSRSEAEQSILVSLANAGHGFDSVLRLFLTYPCAGKFAELYTNSKNNAIRWLRKSFEAAVEWAQSHESPERQFAKSAISWAQSRAWPGRTGSVDRLVYIAHATKALQAGRRSYAASCRDLAELAGIGRMTATRATHRLCSYNLLWVERVAVADCANVYHLQEIELGGTLPHPQFVRRCPTWSNDAFRFRGLGKAAGEVWDLLTNDGPMSVYDLVVRTGRHKKTIERALALMAGMMDPVTGECLPMVENNGDQWRAVQGVDLDHVAMIVGTAGIGKKQRDQHNRERWAHRRSLVRFLGQPKGDEKG
jgi:hypothetical protein